MSKFTHKLTALALAALLIGPTAALSQQVSEVTLLPGWVTEDGTRMAGVRISLSPGWHTYWRQPMGNGIPPQLDWSGSDNVAAVKLHWPAPEVIESYGSRSAGYKDEVIIPVEITPQSGTAPLNLDLAMFYGVCEQVCIPAEAAVSLTVPPGATGEVPALQASLATSTRSGAAMGVRDHSCQITPEDGAFALTASLSTDRRLPTPEMVVFEAGSDEIWISPENWSVKDNRVTIDARLSYYGSGSFALDRSAMTITLLGGGTAIELRGCPAG